MKMQLWLFVACWVACARAANILIMLPLPMYSHTTNYITVFKELAKRGHNVTFVSPFPQKEPLKNWNDIVVRNTLEEMMADSKDLTKMGGWIFDLFGMWFWFPGMVEKILKEEPVQRVIQDTTSSYDLVITESFFCHEPFTALSHKFNAPLVTIHAAGIIPSLAYHTGNHLPPSYVPNMRFQFSDHMTFLERAKNTFFSIWDSYATSIYYYRKMDSLMRQYFVYPGSENLPCIEQLIQSTSLSLVESHLGLHYPRPLHRNVIEVGGINIQDGDALPKDLKKFMDDAPNGVIYFSMGSHFKTSTLNETTQAQIVSAFGKVKQKVIMKWEDPIPNKPSNFLTGKWFPQSSILGHPNCRLFVTHGGLHGVMEGLYQGVPLVGIPIFADQKFNLKFVESIGAGIQLDLSDISEEQLSHAMNTILQNPSYKSNAELRKKILRDNPISQLDNAAYWIEYVIRYKGAPHLRPASLDISWYQYLLLDVALFFALLALAFLATLVILVKILIKLIQLICCRKSANKVSSKSIKSKKSKKE